MSSQTRNEVKARLRPFGIVFEKSLSDLVKGIRSHKDPESQAKFLQEAIQECRKEVRSSDMDLKTMAVLKLAYLEMYGFDMSWANFHVLEVMSSSKFQQKRVGYLAAIQALKNDNDVLMLTTNLLKKDLNSSKSVDVGVALSGISSIVTTPLASDITDDVIKMLNHSKPYIRKKAILTMFKIFLKYPEALRTHLPRLFDKLNDEDQSVVTATITVICELSKKTPKVLINLAPQLYDLLNTSNNNWMSIRLLKLFSSLTSVEPRLKNKLLKPVLELMSTSKASSLIYECVNCLVTGNMIDENDYEVANLCLEELVEFFKEKDQNLKYVGLLAFFKIGKINPEFISSYSEHILEYLVDDDLTIREKALAIVDGIVNDENLFQIVKLLMIQLVPPQENENDSNIEDHGDLSSYLPQNKNTPVVLTDQYKTNIILKILEISSRDNYSNIPTFEWYIAVLTDLIDLSIVNNLITGYEIGEQIRDIAIRVPSIRGQIVSTTIKIITNENIVLKLPQVLKECIWVAGEYSSFIKNGDDLIYKILSFENKLIQLDSEILSIYIPAIMKIFNNYVNKDSNYWDNDKAEIILKITKKIILFFEKLSISRHFEIQERSVEFLEFLKLIIDAINEHDSNAIEPPLLLTVALPSFFNSWELKPISLGSQKRIPIPGDLDLDTVINPDVWEELIDQESEDESIIEEFEEGLYEDQGGYELDDHETYIGGNGNGNGIERSPSEENERRKNERLERLKDDPYYLSNDSHSQILSPKSRNELISPTPRSLTPTLIEIDDGVLNGHKSSSLINKSDKKLKKKKKNVVILSDEVIGGVDQPNSDPDSDRSKPIKPTTTKKRKNVLKIDSSNLDNFDFDSPPEPEKDEGLLEVEKLRKKLESNSITNQSLDSKPNDEVIVIRKKKDKKKKKPKTDENGNPIEKKKKKKRTTTSTEGTSEQVEPVEPVVNPTDEY
ncbi:AP-3 complex subunit delta [Wickerhamomyces ciferrii]|uniref:AP-3 complex subunit delta n=1 Tax=Wickerhamomyces ciferrii (strain ATCC 14091 / BCRC 22168 / CBS 111 / JCM 3599 / NBRC 0793 / NRRL Y-1031 F-60-10) TaxID=1206466 RepID=K0KIF8_WICCF|nr:AP-3 complex subunit delta [Wickerhamomyces ciferrii]CCH41962.1 AP-3 complex subunit delta [Wickerhamomyces ciferrii]